MRIGRTKLPGNIIPGSRHRGVGLRAADAESVEPAWVVGLAEQQRRAGVAGALFAFFGRYASASYMFYHVSGEAVVWTIVGGAGTLLGPVVGTTIS